MVSLQGQFEALLGEKDSILRIEVIRANNSREEVRLRRTVSLAQLYSALPKREGIRSLSNEIMYINLDAASTKEIDSIMPQLQQSKAIICDLRGYPNSNHDFIRHLLKKNDTSSQWMQVPQIIYPDRERITSYQKHGWNLKPQKPYLDAKIFFLIDGQAISYAESYMSFIEHYKLATIIGQPTAGTNGNVNPFTLSGGYSVSWTGMWVQKHNGLPHHGVGILPHVYVQKTISGIRENRDEFLDKAVELARKTQY